MTDRHPEFSRPIAINEIGHEGVDLEIEATPEERKLLAERLGLLALDKLSAGLRVTRAPSAIAVRVRGHLSAELLQRCVVSLEPVAGVIEEPVEAEFGPTVAEPPEEGFTLEDPDPPEPITGDRIDLGELVVQHFAVAIDPYPRKLDAAPHDWRQAADKGAESPFAALDRLKRQRRN